MKMHARKLGAAAVFIAAAFTPQQNPTLIAGIPVKGSFVAAGHDGSLYVVSGSELLRFDRQGKPGRTYSNNTLGNITFADFSNPLRPLLYYRDFSRIVFLDSFLAQNGEAVRLDDLGFPQAELACTSHNNGIWIYDAEGIELIRLDVSLRISHRSGNLLQATGITPNPAFLLQHNNAVYLNNPETGILVFDIYGTYSKTIPLKNLTSFHLAGDELIYPDSNRVVSYHLLTLQEKTVTLPGAALVSAAVREHSICALTADSLKVYRK